MEFDREIPWRGNHIGARKGLRDHFGIDPEEGLAMWVADSAYPTAPAVQDAVRAYADLGGYPYGYDTAGARAAVAEWLSRRHGHAPEPESILFTHGLGHAIAMAIDAFSAPGDGVAYFTPVYHEFRNKTLRTERRPVELPLAREGQRYLLDWEAAEAAIDPGVRILLHCAPQNPSGRVWSVEEMREVAEFAARHDLLLVSDEIHCDLVYAPHVHVPMDVAAPGHRDRTITLFAPSKSFNIPGLRSGQAIIPDGDLRAAYERRLRMTEYQPLGLGLEATKAAFSPEGEAWLARQIEHLEGNREVFDAGIAAIPGLASWPLESTFLAWVDFSGTGMAEEEILARLRGEAKIATSPGPGFGTGGEGFQRFNLACPRATVEEAVRRLSRAFGDLQ